jgi:cytochrome c oxidase subunit 1
MTMTEARPEVGATSVRQDRPPLPGGGAVVDSADHKVVGLVFLATSLLGFLLLRGVGAALGAELVSSGSQIVGDESRRLYSLYETGIVLLWVAPVWLGLATYLLPLQIGSSRLAFPRLQALALWTHVGGAALFIVGHLIDPPPGIGLSSREPLQATVGGINDGTNLILASFLLLGLATLLAAGNLLTTALTLRTEGMTLGRMPLFSWGVVAASAGTLIATPVFLASAFVLYLDLHFAGTNLFSDGRASELVWQKGLWLYGRPEALLVLVPALGAACDMVVHAARRGLAAPPAPPIPRQLQGKVPAAVANPPSGHVLAAGALFAATGFALLTWVTDRHGIDALILPTSSVASALIGAAAGLLVLLWLNTLFQSKPKPSVPCGFVFGSFLLGVTAAVNALIAGLAGVDGKALGQGMIDLITVGVPTLMAFGAMYHWAKKLFGVPLSTGLGVIVLLSALGGTLALGIGQSIAGYAGADGQLKEATGDAQMGFGIAAAGHVLLLLAGLLLALDVARAMAKGRRGSTPADLRDGVTLEWAAASPPPAGNFTELPEVRSEAPLADLAAAKAATSSPSGSKKKASSGAARKKG